MRILKNINNNNLCIVFIVAIFRSIELFELVSWISIWERWSGRIICCSFGRQLEQRGSINNCGYSCSGCSDCCSSAVFKQQFYDIFVKTNTTINVKRGPTGPFFLYQLSTSSITNLTIPLFLISKSFPFYFS